MEEFLLNNNIHCLANLFDGMKTIVIYCHGFGSNKKSLTKHVFELNRAKIGIISFDFPCHGKDSTNYQDVTYDMCYQYIDEVVKFVKNKYPNVSISLMGESFGGYMVLNYINESKMKFFKTVLKCPAINFYECIKRKLNIDDTYFDNNDYFELPSGYKLYKDFYFDSKNHDIMNNFNKNHNDIYIIHGNCDKTVLVDDVIKFAKKNHIKINIIVGAEHNMDNYLHIINDDFIDFLS